MTRPDHPATQNATNSNLARYLFAVNYLCADGELVRRDVLTLRDFQSAVFATCFAGLRNGVFTTYAPRLESAVIEPVFAEGDAVAARVTEFVVRVWDQSNEHCLRFDTLYFGARAQRARAALVGEQRLSAAADLHYYVNAVLDDDNRPAAANGIALGPSMLQLPIKTASRADFGPSESWDNTGEDDLPVLIEHDVLQAVVEETRQNPEHEIAGFLLGNVNRAPLSGEVFQVVSGFVSSAENALASGTSVTFTPDSFAHARRMIQLRSEDEQIVGWVHSHPFRLCADCPHPTPPDCIQKVLFYSMDDVQLMESTFEHPFMVGLLAALEPKLEQALGHLPVRLYGYRHGQIVNRGFEVIRS